jgi:1,4-alpha-glucan branching enzyme
MGIELGQEAEWSESRSLDWWLEETPWHAGLQQLVRDLNRNYKAHPALYEVDGDPAGFEWIDANDFLHNTFSFIRWDATRSKPLVCIVNFSGVPDENYRVGLPHAGRWREVLNTDAGEYSGSGVGNLGAVEAEAIEWHGRAASAQLRVPPLGAVWLVPEVD